MAWGNPEKTIVNGAFMMFEKHHPYLEDYLKNYGTHYNPLNPQAVGNQLLTELLIQLTNSSDVRVVDYNAFYMFYNMTDNKQCFQETSGESFSSNMKIVEGEAYAVQVRSGMTEKEGGKKIKTGTICSYLFNLFCVLCNEIY